MNSPFWHLILSKPDQAIGLLILHYLKFQSALLSYCMISVTRFRFSALTGGAGLTIAGICLMLAFNSTHVFKIFTPFVMFSVPALIFFLTKEELLQLAFVEIHSIGLLSYMGVYALNSIVHTVMIYAGHGSKYLTIRGEHSYLYLLLDKLLSKYMNVSEFSVRTFLETSLFIGAGFCFLFFADDPYFAAFLWLMAANEMILQLTEKSEEIHDKIILDL